MKRETGSGKLVVGGVAAVVAAGAIAYTVVASREALREQPTEREIADARLRPDDRGYFSSANPNRRSPVHPPPAAGCSPEALAEVRRAADVLSDGALHPETAPMLERALDLDPSCVSAGRLLLSVRGGQSLQLLERRFVARADDAPGDAAAQLLAAYYQRETGDGAAYRRYLERASAASPDLPLLHVAWAYYWVAFANPSSVADQLRELEAEVRSSGDPASIAGLVTALEQLGDDEAALGWCRRYYADLPGATAYGLALTCARAAARAGLPEAERTYADRVLAARTAWVSQPCRHADLAHAYLQACRAEEALAEADRAVAGGCEVPGSGHRRTALLALGRYADAASPPPASGYWGSGDRARHALALALSGETAEALAISTPAPEDDAGTPLAGTGAAVHPPRTVHIVHALLEGGAPREQLAAAARCERRTGEAAGLARSGAGYARALALDEARRRIDRALALEPANPDAWVARVYLLSLEGKLDEAAGQGERAIASGVRDAQLLADDGVVHQQRGDCERAVVLYELARERIPLREANYGNLATCLDRLGRDAEAEAVWRIVPEGGPVRRAWPLVAGLVAGVVILYLGVKLALIRLLPDRFGHLRFP